MDLAHLWASFFSFLFVSLLKQFLLILFVMIIFLLKCQAKTFCRNHTRRAVFSVPLDLGGSMIYHEPHPVSCYLFFTQWLTKLYHNQLKAEPHILNDKLNNFFTKITWFIELRHLWEHKRSCKEVDIRSTVSWPWAQDPNVPPLNF